MFWNGKLRASRTNAINFTSGLRSGLASHRLSARAAVTEYTDWGLTQQTLALAGLAAGRLCQGAGLGGFLGRPLPGSVLTRPSLWPRSRPLLIQRESHSEGLTSASPPAKAPPPDTVTLGVRFQHMNLGGTPTVRPYNSHALIHSLICSTNIYLVANTWGSGDRKGNRPTRSLGCRPGLETDTKVTQGSLQ